MRDELERLAERWRHKANQWECGATRAQILEFASDLYALAERLPTEKEVMQIEGGHDSERRPVAPPPSEMGGGDQVPLPEPDMPVYDLRGLYQKVEAAERERDEARAEAERQRKDAERLNWMDANGFSAYRLIDPIDGISGHCVVVHEAMKPRRGNVAGRIREAIDAAILADRGGESQ